MTEQQVLEKLKKFKQVFEDQADKIKGYSEELEAYELNNKALQARIDELESAPAPVSNNQELLDKISELEKVSLDQSSFIKKLQDRIKQLEEALSLAKAAPPDNDEVAYLKEKKSSFERQTIELKKTVESLKDSARNMVESKKALESRILQMVQEHKDELFKVQEASKKEVTELRSKISDLEAQLKRQAEYYEGELVSAKSGPVKVINDGLALENQDLKEQLKEKEKQLEGSDTLEKEINKITGFSTGIIKGLSNEGSMAYRSVIQALYKNGLVYDENTIKLETGLLPKVIDNIMARLLTIPEGFQKANGNRLESKYKTAEEAIAKLIGGIR